MASCIKNEGMRSYFTELEASSLDFFRSLPTLQSLLIHQKKQNFFSMAFPFPFQGPDLEEFSSRLSTSRSAVAADPSANGEHRSVAPETLALTDKTEPACSAASSWTKYQCSPQSKKKGIRNPKGPNPKGPRPRN